MKNRKLSEPRVGPFVIKRTVGRLACELELPKTWKIHPVVSIAELEPLPAGQDPYHRPKRRTARQPVEAEAAEPRLLLDRRVRHVGRNKTEIVEFRTRFKNIGPEADIWMREKDLPTALVASSSANNHERNFTSSSP